MISLSHVTPAIFAMAMIVGGLGLGLAYFAFLRRTADLLAATDGGMVRPALLTLARLGAAVAAFALAARLGALPLLAGFGGFLIARGIAIHQARGTA